MTRRAGRPWDPMQLTPAVQHRLDEVAREYWTGRQTRKPLNADRTSRTVDWRQTYLQLLHDRDPAIAP